LHPSAKYDVEHHKCKHDDDVTGKCLKINHKKNRGELQEDAIIELINPIPIAPKAKIFQLQVENINSC
jgi:hypothetical protein